MHVSKALINGIMAGIFSPGTIGTRKTYLRQTPDAMEKIRGDVRRVGSDFKVVIEREHGPIKERKHGR